MSRRDARTTLANTAPFVAAVAKNHEGHPIALRMGVVEGLRKTELAAWAAKLIHPDSIVVSDSLHLLSRYPGASSTRPW
ncbi:hypothetical protein THIOKS1260021 [Thiocapsa sp. KS1]|nr:hypothetical protein THIOKS1260021 [Thiocapsa sp. KS1]